MKGGRFRLAKECNEGYRIMINKFSIYFYRFTVSEVVNS